MNPLALIVYNRPVHFRRVLNALACQRPEPLYIFCDGPKNKADRVPTDAAWRQIWEVVDWTRPKVFTRANNHGLAKSIVQAVDRTLEDYETVIILEDDCVPGPWFCQWMNACLDRYRDTDIMAVTGYTPIAADKMYFSPRMETWGWGTWRRAWKLYERDVAAAYRRALDKGVDLEQGGSDLPGYMKEAMMGKDVWSAGWQLAAYLNGGLCAYPSKSHIRNIGLDGTGVHCGAAEDTAPLAEEIGSLREPMIDGLTEELRRFYG